MKIRTTNIPSIGSSPLGLKIYNSADSFLQCGPNTVVPGDEKPMGPHQEANSASQGCDSSSNER
jgi:hypothetical protein